MDIKRQEMTNIIEKPKQKTIEDFFNVVISKKEL